MLATAGILFLLFRYLRHFYVAAECVFCKYFEAVGFVIPTHNSLAAGFSHSLSAIIVVKVELYTLSACITVLRHITALFGLCHSAVGCQCTLNGSWLVNG